VLQFDLVVVMPVALLLRPAAARPDGGTCCILLPCRCTVHQKIGWEVLVADA
jgi:hypothetical protein